MRPTLLAAALVVLTASVATARDPLEALDKAYRRQAQTWVGNYLGRDATAEEVKTIVTQLQNGTSPAAVQANILGSDEFYKLAGGTTKGYLNGLYVKILGRPATQQELLPILAKANVTPRRDIALSFLANQGAGVMPGPNLPPGAIPATPPIIVVPVPVPVPVIR